METETFASPAFEADRVRRHTRRKTLNRIDERIEDSIRLYANQPRQLLDRRIAQLEEEWEFERVLSTNASLAAMAGILLGATVSRRWYLVSAGMTALLLMHGTRGWSPPLPGLRRLGVRTQSEIDRELYALKYLRGDFEPIESFRAIPLPLPGTAAASGR
jgi:hypothetical protein